jgi:hypothetical protein
MREFGKSGGQKILKPWKDSVDSHFFNNFIENKEQRMTKKLISVFLVLAMSVFLMLSVGCGGSSSNDSTSPAGISGSAN